MAKKPTKSSRPINFKQFQNQLEDVGVSNLQEVILSDTESIWIRLGNGIDMEDQEEFEELLQDAEDSEAAALLILGYNPNMSAQEQWKLFQKHGGTADQLALLFANATRDQVDRLGKIKTRRA